MNKKSVQFSVRPIVRYIDIIVLVIILNEVEERKTIPSLLSRSKQATTATGQARSLFFISHLLFVL